MRKFLLLSFLIAAFPGLCAAADPTETAGTLAEAASKDPWSFDFLESLTTEIGQRLAATKAEERAAAWAQARLRQAGFQNVHTEPVDMPVWTRGAESAEVVSPAPQHLVITTLGGSVATPAAGITAEMVLFRTYDEMLALSPGALAGKIAVVTQRMVKAEDGSGYGAASPIRRAGPAEAAKRGAIAYLLRSLGTDNHRLAHTGALNYQDGVPRIPAAAMSNADADQLERLAARGPVRLHLLLTPAVHENGRSWTVAGEIKGSERPDEIVLIGAHLDSWDLATGATDDGAGLAIVATAGKLIAALPHPPKRTVRVVMFGAEERDFSGPAYAKAHQAEFSQIVVAGEADFGPRAAYGIALPAGAAKTDFAHSLAKVLTPLGVNLDPLPARFAGEDILGLQAGGVPVFSVHQNGFDYFDTHHTIEDTLDKNDPKELAQNAAVWAAFVYLAADTDVDFRKLSTAAAH